MRRVIILTWEGDDEIEAFSSLLEIFERYDNIRRDRNIIYKLIRADGVYHGDGYTITRLEVNA